MSRITKEEIEKTKCGRFLLSDENIYLSIYSLNSYVFEYNLLNTEDRILYHRLQDKFDARLINRVITRVRKQIIELLDEDKYIEAKVYFKPKKLSENGELEFRPLHSTDLITQIAIVSMLHLFVSVINMAVNEITELAKDDENKPIIMKFAPWNYSDKDNLISMFFQSLKNKINVQDNEELKNKVGKALSDYAGAFDALSLVPVIGSGVAAILKTLAQAKGAELMECADLDMTRRILELR